MATATAANTTPAADRTPIVSPSRLAHVVLRTSRFREVMAWYRFVLNATPVFENEHIGFLSYDEEHHRIAVINIPGLGEQPEGISGVHHVSFAYDRMSDLFDNYERLKANGITPALSINHGPTTSLYYWDPDGNQVEMQVDNYDSVEEATKFFYSDAFAVNPIGVDFDPDTMLSRIRAGEDQAVLKRRPTSGPRGVDDIGSLR